MAGRRTTERRQRRPRPAARGLFDRDAERHRNPAITLPFGMLPTGLPFGLQVTAAHYDDCRLLDIADLVEAAYPWPRTAPGYESLASVLAD